MAGRNFKPRTEMWKMKATYDRDNDSCSLDAELEYFTQNLIINGCNRYNVQDTNKQYLGASVLDSKMK